MSVIGSLEDLAFPDILQIIHASRRSGTLILSLRDGERRARFRDGLICGATLGPGGPEIEDLLRRRGRVDERALTEAASRVGRTGELVAEALVGMGAVSQETIDQVVREELKSSLRSVILAQEGEFRFELEEDRRPLAETVLLLAERSVLRRVLEDELQRGGFNVMTCGTPSEALDRARKLAGGGRAFLLVSDLILPDASGRGWEGGLDLLRAVRRLSPQAGGVLIGDLRERGAEAALRAGATAYVPFPDLGRTDLDEVGTALARFGGAVREAALHPDRVQSPGGAARSPVLAVDHLSLLRGLIGELHAEEEVAIPLLVLRLATEYFERGVLFSVRDREAHGTGAFGGERGEIGKDLDGRVRGVSLPLLAGSVLETAVRTRAPYVGPIGAGDSNAPLIATLGAPLPREAALLPVSAGRQVLAVLYGDNAPSDRPVGDLRGLEIFLAQAGIALHNAALQRRLSELSAGAGGSGAHA